MGVRPNPYKYTPEKRKQIGDDLLAWCKVEDQNWHMTGFEADYGYPVETLDYLQSEYDDFRGIYMQAKHIIANKMLTKGMNSNICDRWVISTFVPMYLRDVRKHRHDEMEFEVDIKERAKSKYAEQDKSEFFEKLEEYLREKNRGDQNANAQDIHVERSAF